MSAFLEDFRELSRFGSTPGGGVDRQAATAADAATRSWFMQWLSANGFGVEIDPIGNIFGRAEMSADAPWIVVGSHLDSQPLAGRFDGAYGVLAAAHAVRTVRDQLAAAPASARCNLAVVDWFNEEGSRFAPSMMGSAVHTGALPLEIALETRDTMGVRVKDALDGIAQRGDVAGVDIAGYVEIHVEQGRVLEDAGAQIGLVTHTWTARKLDIVVRGEQAHTGAARMADRRDALYGAARIVVATRALTNGFPVEALHASVSELHLDPNSPVAIAREVRMLVDIRAPHAADADAALDRLRRELEVIAEDARVDIAIDRVTEWSSGPFLEEGVRIVREEADRRGLKSVQLATVAGHDATNVKEIAPTVLFFVPSVDGLSHNEREFTADEDLVAGLEVLTGVVTRLASGELDVLQAADDGRARRAASPSVPSQSARGDR